MSVADNRQLTLTQFEFEHTKNVVNGLKVTQLKSIVRALGLSLKGLKSDLINRINTYFEQGREIGDRIRLLAVRTMVLKVCHGHSVPDYRELCSSLHSGTVTYTPSSEPSRPANGGRSTAKSLPATSHQKGPKSTSPILLFKHSPFFTQRRLVSGSPYYVKPCISKETRSSVHYEFSLNQEEEHLLKLKPSMRLYLFCGRSSDDNSDVSIQYPNTVDITCNGKSLRPSYKGLRNKLGTASPANLTPYTHLGRRANNLGMVYSGTTEPYLLYIYIVETKSSEALIHDVLKSPHIHKANTIKVIMDEYDDEGIEIDTMSISLRCPITYARLKYPAKGIYCQHPHCFDGLSYLLSQEQVPSWNCPICQCTVRLKDMAISDYIQEILDSTPEDVDQVSLNRDGSWEPKYEQGSGPLNDENKKSPSTSSSAGPPSKSVPEHTKELPHNNAPHEAAIEIVSLDSESEEEPENVRPPKPRAKQHSTQAVSSTDTSFFQDENNVSNSNTDTQQHNGPTTTPSEMSSENNNYDTAASTITRSTEINNSDISKSPPGPNIESPQTHPNNDSNTAVADMLPIPFVNYSPSANSPPNSSTGIMNDEGETNSLSSSLPHDSATVSDRDDIPLARIRSSKDARPHMSSTTSEMSPQSDRATKFVAQRPVENAQRPVENAQRPVEHAQRPVEHAQRPAEHTQRPVENAPRPMEHTQRPVENSQPKQAHGLPQPIIPSPAQQYVVPSQIATSPVPADHQASSQLQQQSLSQTYSAQSYGSGAPGFTRTQSLPEAGQALNRDRSTNVHTNSQGPAILSFNKKDGSSLTGAKALSQSLNVTTVDKNPYLDTPSSLQANQARLEPGPQSYYQPIDSGRGSFFSAANSPATSRPVLSDRPYSSDSHSQRLFQNRREDHATSSNTGANGMRLLASKGQQIPNGFNGVNNQLKFVPFRPKDDTTKNSNPFSGIQGPSSAAFQSTSTLPYPTHYSQHGIDRVTQQSNKEMEELRNQEAKLLIDLRKRQEELSSTQQKIALAQRHIYNQQNYTEVNQVNAARARLPGSNHSPTTYDQAYNTLQMQREAENQRIDSDNRRLANLREHMISLNRQNQQGPGPAMEFGAQKTKHIEMLRHRENMLCDSVNRFRLLRFKSSTERDRAQSTFNKILLELMSIRQTLTAHGVPVRSLDLSTTPNASAETATIPKAGGQSSPIPPTSQLSLAPSPLAAPLNKRTHDIFGNPLSTVASQNVTPPNDLKTRPDNFNRQQSAPYDGREANKEISGEQVALTTTRPSETPNSSTSRGAMSASPRLMEVEASERSTVLVPSSGSNAAETTQEPPIAPNLSESTNGNSARIGPSPFAAMIEEQNIQRQRGATQSEKYNRMLSTAFGRDSPVPDSPSSLESAKPQMNVTGGHLGESAKVPSASADQNAHNLSSSPPDHEQSKSAAASSEGLQRPAESMQSGKENDKSTNSSADSPELVKQAEAGSQADTHENSSVRYSQSVFQHAMSKKKVGGSKIKGILDIEIFDNTVNLPDQSQEQASLISPLNFKVGCISLDTPNSKKRTLSNQEKDRVWNKRMNSDDNREADYSPHDFEKSPSQSRPQPMSDSRIPTDEPFKEAAAPSVPAPPAPAPSVPSPSVATPSAPAPSAPAPSVPAPPAPAPPAPAPPASARPVPTPSASARPVAAPSAPTPSAPAPPAPGPNHVRRTSSNKVKFDPKSISQSEIIDID